MAVLYAGWVVAVGGPLAIATVTGAQATAGVGGARLPIGAALWPSWPRRMDPGGAACGHTPPEGLAGDDYRRRTGRRHAGPVSLRRRPARRRGRRGRRAVRHRPARGRARGLGGRRASADLRRGHAWRCRSRRRCGVDGRGLPAPSKSGRAFRCRPSRCWLLSRTVAGARGRAWRSVQRGDRVRLGEADVVGGIRPAGVGAPARQERRLGRRRGALRRGVPPADRRRGGLGRGRGRAGSRRARAGHARAAPRQRDIEHVDAPRAASPRPGRHQRGARQQVRASAPARAGALPCDRGARPEDGRRRRHHAPHRRACRAT